MSEKGTTTMEKIVRRPADISPIEAKQGLALAFPNAKVASFDTKEENGQLVYVATLVTSEFPPPGGDDESGPPAPPAGDGDGDEDDGGPPAPEGDDDGDEGGPPKAKKEKKDKGGDKVEHQILDALKQLAVGLGVPLHVGEAEPGLEGGPPGAGAPGDDMGGALPPPPVAEDAPLPPPAAPKGAPGGGGGGLGMPFSSVDKYAGDKHVASMRNAVARRRSFSMAYEDGTATPRMVADTVRAMFPDFRVARMEQREGSVDGSPKQPMYVFGLIRN